MEGSASFPGGGADLRSVWSEEEVQEEEFSSSIPEGCVLKLDVSLSASSSSSGWILLHSDMTVKNKAVSHDVSIVSISRCNLTNKVPLWNLRAESL